MPMQANAITNTPRRAPSAQFMWYWNSSAVEIPGSAKRRRGKPPVAPDLTVGGAKRHLGITTVLEK